MATPNGRVHHDHAGHRNQDHHDDAAAIPSATAKYFCPMCPGVQSDEPGDCPRCGMALERSPAWMAYCLTTHKAQGMTAERAFVLLGGGMQDRHTSYVQLSRAREESHLFATEDRPDLERHMNRSRPKTLATDQRSRPELVLALER